MNPLSLLRAAYGGALLAAPRAILELYGGSGDDESTVVVARVLGARHLLQALVQRGGALPRLGAAVDAFHAASMLALAATATGHRKPALVDGTIATSMAVMGMAGLRRRL